ncbi:HNH endonuclease [Psychrosphaera ytuae]|uniref:HNH endonuclease n=2 Tax=Psychrosphaera ytuae TaxID=2820710 RepID=A0A975DEE1_9GAMM|nr:HNH endonuclease [Psychrosphaera ytuae]
MFKVTGINENKPGQPFYGDCKWVYDTEELTEYEHLVGRLIVRPKRIIGRSVYRLAENIADDLEIVEYSPQAFNSSKVKGLSSIEEMHNEFNDELKKAFELESATLVEKSKSYPNKPASINTIVSVFKRNPYVTAIVLKNANGVCGNCNRTAPFKRKKDGSPYLEVHHRKTLANGGDDTVENCIALCPNCHREMHYG